MLEFLTPLQMFVIGTAALALASAGSLRAPGSHGFTRFFGFTAVLALVALNYPHWDDGGPRSARQMAAAALFMLSLVTVLYGLAMLVLVGRRDAARADGTLFGFEQTATLVTRGIYRFIRHPMYASALYFAAGVLIKHPSPAALAAFCIALVCIDRTARREERECQAYFGPAYADYMRRSRRFLPLVY